MNLRYLLIYWLCSATMTLSVAAAPVKISSPDGKIELQVMVDKNKTEQGLTAHYWGLPAGYNDITDWTLRTMDISFDFLEEGKTYRMEIIKDGVNADVTAVDNKKEVAEVKKGAKTTVNLASGGGWIAKISKQEL